MTGRKITVSEKEEIFECATVGNWSYERIAREYEISEKEVEQIVLSFVNPKAQ